MVIIMLPCFFTNNAILVSEFCWVYTREFLRQIMEERRISIGPDSILSFDKEIIVSGNLKNKNLIIQ